jgi:hypothetical protein
MTPSLSILLIVEITLLTAAAQDLASPQSRAEAIDIGSQRELFVEDGLIDRLVGKAELRLHHPISQKVVLKHDEPWEGSGSVYHSIFKDGDRYRMYYAAGQLTVTSNGVDASAHSQFCCYAESDDGIHWRKPALGLHEFQGSKANNIVMVKQRVGDAMSEPSEPAVFKDENPDAPPDARYKALLPANFRPKDFRRGLLVFKSPDGLRWSPMSDKPRRVATKKRTCGIRRDIVPYARPHPRTSSTGRTRRTFAMSIRHRSSSTQARSNPTIARRIC